MSHFVRVRTVLREKDLIRAALRDLGHETDESPAAAVRGDRGRTEAAEIVVRTGSSYDIGLRPAAGVSDGSWEVVADWYWVERSTSFREKEFLDGLAQRYAYRVVLAQAKEQNLIVTEERREGGDIVIVLSEKG